MPIVVPHTSLHDIRTPLYKSLGRSIGDILVVYDKAILGAEDYPLLRKIAEEKLAPLAKSRVGLVLTGSYAACIIVYDVLKSYGCNVVLLQYDPHLRLYQVVRA
jgi:hypothetical protein